jgi:hypothetical protein
MDGKVTAFEVEQAARTAEVVQQMAIDVEKVCIIADAGDDMPIPNLGQHGATTCLQVISSLYGHRFSPFIAVWHDLM